MKTLGLYVRCLAWGLATGAAVGGGVGFVAGCLLAASSTPAWAAGALLLGIIYGALVAVVPTLLGGFVVVVVVIRRHPHPASFDSVQQDLGVVFASIGVALNLLVLVWWLVLGGWSSQMLVLLAVLVLIDAATAAVLYPARASIARGWVEAQA